MLANDLKTKRCLMVCGGGGVGKTTLAACIAIAATRVRPRVLVVTIDPAKRLAEAFGFSIEEMLAGGEPKKLDASLKARLGIPDAAELSVGILNPKYILNQILDQVLTPTQKEKLTRTALYSQMSEMVYGLQEYTAYEWVTRMIQGGMYDFIVLDTPPAFHAKDFFNVPEKIRNLMQSRVFQLFAPKKPGFFASFLSGAMSFPWIEKLLGARIFAESRMFFETFTLLRDRILERCDWLSRFFSDDSVAVAAVSTIESSSQLELEGLTQFLKERRIPLGTILINQLESMPPAQSEYESEINQISPALLEKWNQLKQHQTARAENAQLRFQALKVKHPQVEVIPVPMVYSEQGLDLLKIAADRLS